jgi:hypothetical protein
MKTSQGGLQLGEGAVVGAQVGVLGHDVGLGELHRGLDPALGGRVRGLARQHRDAVMPGEVQGLLVADRDPGDVRGGHRFLVIGEHVGGRATQDPEGAVQGREHARCGPVPQRDHDPEAGPGQPCDEQDRLHALDAGPVAEIVLQPVPRLRDPRPVDAGMAQPVGGLDLRNGPAGGPLRTGVAQPEELFMGLIRADPALGLLDPFLDPRQIGIGDPAPGRRLGQRTAGVAGRDVPGHGVVGTAGQLGRRSKRSGQIVGSKNFQDFSVMLHAGPLPG